MTIVGVKTRLVALSIPLPRRGLMAKIDQAVGHAIPLQDIAVAVGVDGS